MSDALQQAKLRGDEARRLLDEEDGILRLALKSAKAMYIDQWANSQPFEDQKRELTYKKLSIIGDVEAMLRNIIGNGALAEQQIKALQQRQKR
jgi:hypothetical protein